MQANPRCSSAFRRRSIPPNFAHDSIRASAAFLRLAVILPLVGYKHLVRNANNFLNLHLDTEIHLWLGVDNRHQHHQRFDQQLAVFWVRNAVKHVFDQKREFHLFGRHFLRYGVGDEIIGDMQAFAAYEHFPDFRVEV